MIRESRTRPTATISHLVQTVAMLALARVHGRWGESCTTAPVSVKTNGHEAATRARAVEPGIHTDIDSILGVDSFDRALVFC